MEGVALACIPDRLPACQGNEAEKEAGTRGGTYQTWQWRETVPCPFSQ